MLFKLVPQPAGAVATKAAAAARASAHAVDFEKRMRFTKKCRRPGEAGPQTWGPRARRLGYPRRVLARAFSQAGSLADRLVRRFMPDPFALVLLLTLVSLALGLATMPDVPGDSGGTVLGKGSALVDEWARGFGDAEILKFGLQIILVVVTGEA